MSYGIQLFDDGGALLFDSSTAPGGVIADIRTVPVATTDTWTYPSFTGRSIRVFALFHFGIEPSTVDYALGYPRVNVASGQERILIVVVT